MTFAYSLSILPYFLSDKITNHLNTVSPLKYVYSYADSVNVITLNTVFDPLADHEAPFKNRYVQFDKSFYYFSVCKLYIPIPIWPWTTRRQSCNSSYQISQLQPSLYVVVANKFSDPRTLFDITLDKIVSANKAGISKFLLLLRMRQCVSPKYFVVNFEPCV